LKRRLEFGNMTTRIAPMGTEVTQKSLPALQEYIRDNSY